MSKGVKTSGVVYVNLGNMNQAITIPGTDVFERMFLDTGKPDVEVDKSTEFFADDEDEFQSSKNRRPISRVPDIQRQFKNDPKTAVQENVGLHFNPEQLDNMRPQIQKIADAHERQSAVIDKLWQNEDYEFIQMVMGMTRNTTLLKRTVEMGRGAGAIPLMYRDSRASDEMLKANNMMGFSPMAPPASDMNNPAAAAVTAVAGAVAATIGAQTRGGAIPLRRQEELQMLESIDKLMEEPSVSGEIQMSPELAAAVDKALVVGLATKNKKKYENKTRFHFYKDRSIKILFADLVRAYILNAHVEFSDTYKKVVDQPRSQKEIIDSIEKLDNNCTWSEIKKHFVLSSEEETSINKHEKRQKMMDAYVGIFS